MESGEKSGNHEDQTVILKSLNKARQENEGKEIKNFEVMDNIYHKVR